GGNTVAAFGAGLRADLEAIDSFRRDHHGRVSVEVLELRLPPDLLDTERPEALTDFFTSMQALLEGALRSPFTAFYEPPPGPDWRTTLSALVPFLPGGFKLRTGGLEAAAFPPPEQVATTLVSCARWALPFKATAGLHHPLRHFDADLQTPAHGF